MALAKLVSNSLPSRREMEDSMPKDGLTDVVSLSCGSHGKEFEKRDILFVNVVDGDDD